MNTKWNTDLYDTKHNFVFEYGAGLIDILNPKPDEYILDIGCGTGALTKKIQDLGANVLGIDASQDMIAKAKQEFSDTEFLVANAADFSFPSQFDAIFSNATLHWVLEYKEAAKCMYDALKPNGRLVIEFGGKGNVDVIVKTLRMVLTEYGYVSQSKLEQWYFPSVSEYTQVLEAIGFEVELAQLYKRPTLLADEQTGITDWLSMFAGNFFTGIEKEKVSAIKEEVQKLLKPVLFKDGNWYADYKRLRIVATKN
ncbi:Methyltransferase domain-containing protein [Pustulibacterium marinum]|uniref:Methyltransferase domain-containing protein n=1 Tax=Pustulibacterium marinum TaxID=1224947 RepID=A0A1I7G2W9_9FLAO|nr:class I SAM-dependent methyltransferase [Pustulibacterium marinum]SFU42616.1 Methyltransferase domain-containing protein [Pustulibacterium marinum]